MIDYLADRLVTKNAWQRFSPSDLVIGEWLGDIKTSTYFVQVATPLAHDFYVVRLSIRGQIYTIVVLLKPSIWNAINGDTVAGTLESLKAHRQTPVQITQAGHKLVALVYDEWKRRILVLQGGS